MKLAGFLLLLSGWIIALAAMTLLTGSGARAAFLLAGIAIEFMGLALAFRAHLYSKEERG